MNFEKKESFTSEIIEAAIKRLKDIDNYDFSNISLEKKALDFAKANPSYYPYIPGNIEVFNSFKKNLSLKNLKYFINLLNIKTEKLEDQTLLQNEYIYSLIKELENESLNLEAFNEEKRIKFFQGATFSSFNSFSKDSAFGLKFSNKDFLIDFKTKRLFRQNEICSTIKNLGLSLPIISKNKIPIIDIEVINEETTSGDTELPLRESPTSNLIDKNKSYHYTVLFKKSDKKRKYLIDQAELTLKLELGSKMPINNIKTSSSSTNPFEMSEISYINDSGERIKINEVSLDGTFESSYIFDLIETDTVFLKFKQVTPVGFSTVASKKEEPLDKILRTGNLISGSSENIEDIEGYVYDISINEIEINLFTYGERGIFRSELKEVSNLISLNIRESSVIPSLISLSQSYLQEYLILSDDVLIEKYLGLKFFNSDGSVLFNDVIPLIDNNYKQTEYLDGDGNEMRLKLFPLMFSKFPKNYISKIELVEECYTWTEEVEQPENSFSPATVAFPEEIDLVVEDDEYTAEFKAGLLEGINDWVQESLEMEIIDKIITDMVIKDIVDQNIVGTILDGFLKGNSGYGVINIKDFIIDDGMGALTGYPDYLEGSIPLDVYVGYEYFQNELGSGTIRIIDPKVGFDVQKVLPSDLGLISKWNLSSLAYNTNFATMTKIVSADIKGIINTNRINLYSQDPNFAYTDLDLNAHNKTEEDINEALIEYEEISNSSEVTSCAKFYKITFDKEHNFVVGESFEFFIADKNFILKGIVTRVVDSKTVLVSKNLIGSLSPSILNVDLSGENYFQVEDSNDYIEIFEEARKLKVGQDFLLSPDNGSNWYQRIPLDIKTSFISKKAKAGDFLVKIKKFDKNKLYIGKYFVSPYQSLSKDGKVLLKNKRLEIQSPLSESEGVASAILVMRSGFKNKYLSPIVYEYNMYGYENKPAMIKKGLEYNKSLKDKKRTGRINVN